MDHVYYPTDQVYAAYGFDPALRHGAVVRSLFHFSDERNFIRLLELSICFRWNQRSPLAISSSSSIEDIQRLGSQIILSLDRDDHAPIAVDWDRTSVYWAKGSAAAQIQLAFMLGYICRGWQTRGRPVVFVQPQEIRSQFGLRAKTEKAEVWSTFQEHVKVTQQMSVSLQDRYADLADAVILSYFIAQAQRKIGRKDQQPLQIGLIS